MAVQSIPLATYADNTCQISLQYEDTTNLITSVTLVNNGGSGNLYVAVLDRNTHAVVWSGSQVFGAGTSVRDLSGFNQHMVTINDAKGSRLGLPFDLRSGWSST